MLIGFWQMFDAKVEPNSHPDRIKKRKNPKKTCQKPCKTLGFFDLLVNGGARSGARSGAAVLAPAAQSTEIS